MNAWREENKSLVKELEFKTFKEAIAFVDELAKKADQVDHHPDIRISYTRIMLALTTHDEGGITQKDRELAKFIDTLYKKYEV